MALGTTITSGPEFKGGFFSPGACTMDWVTVIDAAGMDDQDAATITNPTTQITASTRKIFRRNSSGPATLRLRLAYAGTPSTDPVIRVFGRTGSGVWQRLYNKAATPATSVTLTTATASDVTDATMKYTECNPLTHSWDVDGCDEFLVGVETAYAVSAGSAATAYLQGKFV